MENNQSWYRDFKIGKIYTGDEGVIEDDHRCDWGTEELLEDGVIKPIETFEKDGHTWIRHSGGECPVPDEWFVEVMIDKATGKGRSSRFFWGDCSVRIDAYRIISTGEQVACDDVRRHTESVFERYSGTFDRLATMASILVPESITAVEPSPGPDYGAKIKADVSESGYCVEFTFEDSRPLSPQETAYAAKMAEKDEDESGAGGGKTFPSSALRDMSDKTFANLLGMGQFIGGEE